MLCSQKPLQSGARPYTALWEVTTSSIEGSSSAKERAAFLAATRAARPARTLCGVLYATTCRVSEALALTPEQVDFTGKGWFSKASRRTPRFLMLSHSLLHSQAAGP
jgi:site-specific recombinase XerD